MYEWTCRKMEKDEEAVVMMSYPYQLDKHDWGKVVQEIKDMEIMLRALDSTIRAFNGIMYCARRLQIDPRDRWVCRVSH